jgi:hypothetical protein
VSLRSTLTPGAVKITARAEGLAPATLDLAVQAAQGDAPVSADALPVSLARGPTPATPSYKVWRTSVKVASVKAGSNAAAAGLASDDDETTHWASNGDLSTAWIEYDLAKPTIVDDVELKMIGWRLRSYPLRITMDGKVVYEGEPAKNLGYVTLPLKSVEGKPVKGSRLRIALTSPTVDRDAFGKIVEITGARAGLDTGAEKVKVGGALGIIEAELHATARP